MRLVFEDLLKLADKDGIVDMTRSAISRRTNVPIKIVSHGIGELEKPDRDSRSKEHEGRRIVRLDEHRDWGWRIVNYTKYRETATKDMLRMGEAERKKAYRSKFPPRPPSTKKKNADADAEQSRTCPGHVRDNRADFQEINGLQEGIPEHSAWLRKRLCVEYKRPDTDTWGYEESRLMVEIAARPSAMDETQEIFTYRSRNGGWFPLSILSLLQGWTKTLDNARNWKPKKLHNPDSIKGPFA